MENHSAKQARWNSSQKGNPPERGGGKVISPFKLLKRSAPFTRVPDAKNSDTEENDGVRGVTG